MPTRPDILYQGTPSEKPMNNNVITFLGKAYHERTPLSAKKPFNRFGILHRLDSSSPWEGHICSEEFGMRKLYDINFNDEEVSFAWQQPDGKSQVEYGLTRATHTRRFYIGGSSEGEMVELKLQPASDDFSVDTGVRPHAMPMEFFAPT